MIGVVVPADPRADAYTVEWEQDAHLLPLLYREIGCDSVDSFRIRLPFADLTVWVDDTGLLAEAPAYNDRLLRLAHSLGYMADSLAGTALITGPVTEAGDMTGLPADTVAGLLAFLGDLTEAMRAAASAGEGGT